MEFKPYLDRIYDLIRDLSKEQADVLKDDAPHSIPQAKDIHETVGYLIKAGIGLNQAQVNAELDKAGHTLLEELKSKLDLDLLQKIGDGEIKAH